MSVFNWFNQLFCVREQADIKDLTRRRFTMGAQIVFALWTLCQPIIMFVTEKTAIARMCIDYGIYADILGALVLFAAVALIVDVWFFLHDLHDDQHYTTSPAGRWLAHNRYWLLLICSFWAVALMSAVRAESGLGSWFAYGMYFIVQAGIGVALAIRDGCIVNQKQRLKYLALQNSKECGVAENVR